MKLYYLRFGSQNESVGRLDATPVNVKLAGAEASFNTSARVLFDTEDEALRFAKFQNDTLYKNLRFTVHSIDIELKVNLKEQKPEIKQPEPEKGLPF